MPASTSSNAVAGGGGGLFAGSASAGGVAASSSLSLNSLEMDASNGHLGSSSAAAGANPGGMTAATAAGLDENSRYAVPLFGAVRGFNGSLHPHQDGRPGAGTRAPPGQHERPR